MYLFGSSLNEQDIDFALLQRGLGVENIYSGKSGRGFGEEGTIGSPNVVYDSQVFDVAPQQFSSSIEDFKRSFQRSLVLISSGCVVVFKLIFIDKYVILYSVNL